MDISERRYIPQSIYTFIKSLKFNSYPVLLLGTAGLASQKYYSDFDLFTQITKKDKSDNVYNKIMKIINKMDSFNDAYFIELKLQTKKGDKLKYNHIEEINKDEFKKYFEDIDFIKLDYVIRIGNQFIELYIIYSFNITNKSAEELHQEYIISVSNDVKQLKKEGNYFKALKRIFAIYNSKRMKNKLENTDNYINLSKFFNSDYGKLYAETANLKAIKLLLENYDDEETIKRALLNLKDIKVDPNLDKIDTLIKLNERKYNSKAKQVLTQLNKSIK
jgi:hypothetical protein